MCSYYNKCSFEKDSHDGGLEHSLMKEKKIDLHKFFYPSLCSAIHSRFRFGNLKNTNWCMFS